MNDNVVAIAELVGVAPAPTRRDWDEAEAALGHALPDDLKDLGDIFHDGLFDGFMFLVTPSDNQYVDLVAATGGFQRQFRPPNTDLPFSNLQVEYEQGLLLPWALTDNGDIVVLVRQHDDPTDWTVAVLGSRAFEWQPFDLSASAFMLAFAASW